MSFLATLCVCKRSSRVQIPERLCQGQDAGPSTLAPVAPADDAYATMPCCVCYARINMNWKDIVKAYAFMAMHEGVSSTRTYRRRRSHRLYDVIVGVLAAVSEAGVEVGGVASCVDKGVFAGAAGTEDAIARAGADVVVGICEGTGVVPVDAGVRGAGVEDRVWAGEGEGSVDRKHRSLIVSLGAFVGTVGSRSSCDCWKLDRTPLDSSDELSLPSGVESESKRCSGDRRFRVREAWSSCSPSTLGLGLFLERPSALNCTLGLPSCGPAALRTDE